MRQVFKFCLVGTIAWAVGFGVNFSALDTDLSWALSLDRIKSSIARDMERGPRIFLLGGSGTHYSVSAEIVEARTGCTAINYGLHGGLGINPLLSRVESHWRQGDLVVIIPEWGLLAGDGTGWLTSSFGAGLGQPGVGGFGPKQKVQQWLKAGSTSLHGLGKSIWVVLTGESGRAPVLVGARGDTEVFLDDLSFVAESRINSVVSVHVQKRLRYFVEQASRGDVHVAFSPPFVFAEIDAVVEMRQSALHTLQTLESFGPIAADPDFLGLSTDRTLFSDSPFHASPSGRTSFSESLAKELVELLGERQFSCRTTPSTF